MGSCCSTSHSQVKEIKRIPEKQLNIPNSTKANLDEYKIEEENMKQIEYEDSAINFEYIIENQPESTSQWSLSLIFEHEPNATISMQV